MNVSKDSKSRILSFGNLIDAFSSNRAFNFILQDQQRLFFDKFHCFLIQIHDFHPEISPFCSLTRIFPNKIANLSTSHSSEAVKQGQPSERHPLAPLPQSPATENSSEDTGTHVYVPKKGPRTQQPLPMTSVARTPSTGSNGSAFNASSHSLDTNQANAPESKSPRPVLPPPLSPPQSVSNASNPSPVLPTAPISVITQVSSSNKDAKMNIEAARRKARLEGLFFEESFLI